MAKAIAVGCVLAAASVASAAAFSSRSRQPIGVFDSGVGGLTVLERLLTLDRVDNATGEARPDGLPDLAGEAFVQLADQANLHYGSYAASGETGCAFLRELAIRDALFLLSSGYYRDAGESFPSGAKEPAKIVVVACNTATAYALGGIETTFRRIGSPVKVIGVVNAGARSALDLIGTKRRSVGVMSTPGTFTSGVYPRTIAAEALRRGIAAPRVIARGCHNLADSIQFCKPDAPDIVRRYFREIVTELKEDGSDAPLGALVFGCTHYPLAKAAFEKALAEIRADSALAPFVADDFAFVDPADETAAECRATLAADGLLARRAGDASVEMYVSVPAGELPRERIGADGTLEDGYKYSRKPNQDVVDTKFVPLAAGMSDRRKLDQLLGLLPAVRSALADSPHK